MRVDLWESKLDEYLKTVGPFEWGQNDCCLFVANAILEITGNDVSTPYRGYKTRLGAMKKIKNLSIENLWTKILGDCIPAKMCKRGDVVLYNNNGDPLVGICIGSQFVALREDGLIYLPMSFVEKGWKV